MAVNVLEFGSSMLRVVVADTGVNSTFNIQSIAELNYDGYMEGDFVNHEKLREDIKHIVENASKDIKKEINELVIGVPGEFSTVVCKMAQVAFDGKKVITKEDVWKLFDEANDLKENKNISLISTSAINLELDDGRRVTDPVGQKSSKLSGTLSLIYAETSFIEEINEIMKSIGVFKVEYVSEPFCTATYILPREERENRCILIDGGYLSTSVSVVKGDGLEFLSSFSIGRGHIVADLAEGFDLSFDEAELLLSQIVLSLSNKSSESYEIVRNGTALKIPLAFANEIVAYRLDMIGQAINKCLLMYNNQNSAFVPVYITGGGLTKIQGAKDYLSKCMGKNILLAKPPLPLLDKPWFSARLGLLNMALSGEKKKKSFIAKIFKR